MSNDPRHYEARADLLADRVILITGAGDGIGAALAKNVADCGARVLLLGRTVSKLETVYDNIEATGGLRPSIIEFDLETADGPMYQRLANSIESEFGVLDGLVHNAGILGEMSPFEHYDLTTWQTVMHVNLTAALAMTQVLLPVLKTSADPSLIFTSSGVGRQGRAYWGAYSVSKFATEGFVQILADENRNGPLRVNAINPGGTRTAMRLKAYPAEDRDKLPAPEDILAAYLYLLGPDSKGVSGQSIDAQ